MHLVSLLHTGYEIAREHEVNGHGTSVIVANVPHRGAFRPAMCLQTARWGWRRSRLCGAHGIPSPIQPSSSTGRAASARISRQEL